MTEIEFRELLEEYVMMEIRCKEPPKPAEVRRIHGAKERVVAAARDGLEKQ